MRLYRGVARPSRRCGILAWTAEAETEGVSGGAETFEAQSSGLGAGAGRVGEEGTKATCLDVEKSFQRAEEGMKKKDWMTKLVVSSQSVPWRYLCTSTRRVFCVFYHLNRSSVQA